MAVVFPAKLPVSDGSAYERWCNASAFHWQNLFPAEFGGILRAGDIDAGRHEVDDMSTFLTQRTTLFNSIRPVGDEWGGNAALMFELFLITERCVR